MLSRAWETACVDLTENCGFSIVKGFRVGCWVSIIPAGGMVLLPNNVPYCYCSFMHRTAMGLATEDNFQRRWAYCNARLPRRGAIGHIGLNLGAPGDRRDGDGLLWLALPRPYSRHEAHVYGRLLQLGNAVTISREAEPYRHNADRFARSGSDVPWLAASGVRGPARLTIDVSRMPADKQYRIRFTFSEPKDVKPGQRVFNVLVNGEELLSDFDIMRAAGRKHVAVSREFTVTANGSIRISLVSKTGVPLISGIEIEPVTHMR
jgi:hypothetical protein